MYYNPLNILNKQTNNWRKKRKAPPYNRMGSNKCKRNKKIRTLPFGKYQSNK